jgi:hypothetical protein
MPYYVDERADRIAVREVVDSEGSMDLFSYSPDVVRFWRASQAQQQGFFTVWVVSDEDIMTAYNLCDLLNDAEQNAPLVVEPNVTKCFLDDTSGLCASYMLVQLYTDGSYHCNVSKITSLKDARRVANLIEERYNITINSINEGYFKGE